MTRKVGIIGMGHVGSAVAHGLAAQGTVDDFVFIDINEAKAKAEALDFQDAMANLEFNTNFVVNDWAAMADADIVISAVGNIGLNKNNAAGDRFVELKFTQKQVPDISKKLVASGFKGILIVITNPVDVITNMYQKFTGFPKERVIGTGTLLDSARMKRSVGTLLGINARSVSGYNLGEHGNSQFTAWSTVTVKGQPIVQVAEETGLDLTALDDEARRGGYTVFSGKEFTSYGIASAAIKLTKVIMTDAHEELAVSNYREEYGTYVSYPVIIGRAGVIDEVKLALTNDEASKLAASAHYIKTRYDEVIDMLNIVE